MPLKFLQSTTKWPKAYGFEIYGKGPTYVVSVEAGSSASQAGLVPGDQLLEVNGQDVSAMGTSAVKSLAKQSRQQPPALEVVACVSRLLLDPQGLSGYGFSVLNERPVVVGSVEYGGPAFESGLRVGDVILEVNGRRTEKVEAVGSVLSQRSGRLSMLTIPVGRTGNLVHVDKGLSQLPNSDPRVHRAKDLYDKLGEVLGEDYDRKMTVVAILKQYAEDRDIDILCRSLSAVLNSPNSRAILRHIRVLVSPPQRPIFDDMMRGTGMMTREMGGSPSHSYISGGRNTPALRATPSTPAAPPTPTAHTLGSKKLIQVIRENGSFGFVVKGCSPAYIESVDTHGPAEMAGLAAGDFIIKLNGLDVRRCDHDRLIQLLQDSGSTPTLQILRCQAGQQPMLSPANSLSSLNSCSTESSHASDLMPFEQQHVDSQGKTFTQHADFLLTTKERSVLKRTLQQYELNRDVVTLYASLEPVLDTPSKRTLWKFILVYVQRPHHDYILHRVGLPAQVLTEILNEPSSRTLAMFTPRSVNGMEGEVTPSGPVQSQTAGTTTTAPTFHHHIDFLLTSTERQQFKSAIQAYQDSQDLQPLVEVMGLILDTPSKRMLWRYVLPTLTPAHQGVVRHMMDIPDTHSVSGLSLSAMDSYIGSYEENSQQVDTATNTEDDVLYGAEKDKDTKEDDSSSDAENESSIGSDSVSERKPMKLKSQALSRSSSSREDQALLHEVVATRRAVEEVKKAIRGKAEDRYSLVDTDRDDVDSGAPPNMESKHFVTIIPVGYPGFDVNRRPFYSKEMDSPEFSKLRKFVTNKQGAADMDMRPGIQGRKFKDDGDDSSDSDSETVYSLQTGCYPMGETFNHKAMVALKELDEVMAAEASSDPDSPRHQFSLPDTQIGKANPSVSFRPPPPPPPPLPPPLASNKTGGLSGGQDSVQQMNVKRINWEKLDNKHVENTIWEQLCDSDLSEVIRYLELETQFSTKPSKTRDKDKKKEVCVMHSKKAYNISILLGHLKMSVGEIKQAVYLMDEETLTPELLPQLITYAPSKQEMMHYDAYTGDIDDLSKPDQFSYEMSQVYGYEQRLKALLFKANFREKTDEMKENLRSIRVASSEIRHSKKLARLLELILAMGNYMNKGNSRVGEAAGFRITFLTQLDITKTADSKSTFLHVLADTCYNKFHDLLTVADDLPTLSDATKVSSSALGQEIQDLRKGLQEISTALDKIGSHGHTLTTTDHFQDVMGHFISEASDEIQSILSLQASVLNEFSAMVSFFGEDPHLVNTEDIFNIFFNFVDKFERAHRHNMMYKRR